MKALFFPLLVCLLVPLRQVAQDDKPAWLLSGGVGAGFIIPHHPEMKYIIEGHVKCAEVNLLRRVDADKDWHHAFNFPYWGVSVTGFDLASAHLGWAVSALFVLDLPLEPSRTLWLKMGIGAGYIEKPFDAERNFHNTAIGSHLNAALAVEATARVNISERMYTRAGIALHHFSNGAMKMPNSGINLPVLKLTAGLDGGHRTMPERRASALSDPYWHYYTGASFGAKEILPIGSRKYAVGNVFVQANRRFSAKSSYGLEVGLNYNESLRYRQEVREGQSQPGANYRAFMAGLYQLHFDPFALRLQAGGYIAPRFTGDGSIFFRYHLLYELGRFNVFGGLKSHFAKADNIELGTALRLK